MSRMRSRYTCALPRSEEEEREEREEEEETFEF
jgi:hypothetical protein